VAPPAPGTGAGRAWFHFLLLVLAGGCLYLFASYVTDVVLALLLAGMTGGVYARLLARLKWPVLAAALTCLLVVLVVLGPFTLLVVSLSTEAAALVDVARTSVSAERVTGWLFGDGWLATKARDLAATLGVTYTPGSVKTALGGAVSTVARFLYDQANALLSNSLKFLFHLAIMVVALFYLLMDGEAFRRFLLRASPLPDDEDELVVQKFLSVGRAILWGNGVCAVAQGVLGAVAMSLAGFGSVVLWGTVMAMTAFLPMVGISLVSLPATAILVAEGRYATAALFFLFCTAQSFILENVVKTRLIGSQMRMHDLVILLSVIAGVGVFGLLGILYGPLLVALFLVFLDLYESRYRDHAPAPGHA
jgi:predicted PurR-regulated permease PerM